MKDNLPVNVEEYTIFEKIKNFFRRIFFNKKTKIENVKTEKVVEQKTTEKENIKESIKIDINTIEKEKQIEIEREKFLDELDNNHNLFYELPISKLENLKEYYKKSIEKYNQKLKNIMGAQ